MIRDYMIIYVDIWNQPDFQKFHELTKNYDDEGLKTLMFPEGVISRIEILRPINGEKEDE